MCSFTQRLGRPLLVSLALAMVVLPSRGSATVHPLDAIIPDDTPMPSRGMVGWIPSAGRRYTGKGMSFASGVSAPAEATTFDGTPGMDLSAGNHTHLELTGPIFTPSDHGFTVVVDYLRIGSPVPGWNPVFSIRTVAGLLTTPIWSLALKDGVLRLESHGSTAVLSAPTAKAKDATSGKHVKERLDDQKVHQIALRVSRPGCKTTPCPAPGRNLVTLLVDGVVVAEGILTTPHLKKNAVSSIKLGAMQMGWGSSKKYGSQTNWHGSVKTLSPVGHFRQFLVYDRPLATGELLSIKRAASLGVVGQFPPPGAQTSTEVRYSTEVPASDLKLGPNNATSSANMLRYSSGAEGLQPDSVKLNRGTTTVSGWIRAPQVSKKTTLLSVTFPGMSQPLDLAVAPGSTYASHTDFSCTVGGKNRLISVKGGAKPRWHHITIYFDGDNERASCALDGALVGGLDHFLGSPSGYSSSTLSTTKVVKHGVFDVAYLAERRRRFSGFPSKSLYHAEHGFVGRDPLAQGPMVWQRGAKTVRYPQLVYGSGGVPLPLGHALGNLRELGTGLWTYSDKDQASRADRQTVVITFSPEPSFWSKAADEELYYRFHKYGYRSMSVHLAVPKSKSVCHGGNACYFISLDIGPRRFRFQAPVDELTTKLQGAGTLVFTTPYKRSAARLKEWGITSPTVTSSWQPDVVLNGKRIGPKSWLELKSPLAAKMAELGDPKKSTVKAWAQSYASSIGRSWNGVTSWRAYPHVLGDLSGLGLSSCSTLACGDSGRACVPGKDGLSGRCGNCTDGHYRVAGRVGGAFQECRSKRPRGAACLADGMCASGRCDTEHTGTCVFKTQPPCDAACSAQGRLCVKQGEGYDCGWCKPWFDPVNGAPLPKPGTPKPKLLPAEACAWAPTKSALETCTANAQCASGSCAVATVDRVAEILPSAPIAKESLTPVSGFKDCEKSTVQCSTWTVTQGKATLIKSIKDTKKTCAVVITPGLKAHDDPCVAHTGKTHDASTKTLITRPDGSSAMVARCGYGLGGQCVEVGLTVQPGVLSQAACKRAFSRPKLVYTHNRKCHAYEGKTGLVFPKCKKVHGSLGYTHYTYPTHAAHRSLTKTPSSAAIDPYRFEATDLVRLFYPFENPNDANDPNLVYDEAKHRDKLLKSGVSRLMLEFAKADHWTRKKMEATYGKFLPVSMCSRRPIDELTAKKLVATQSNWATYPWMKPNTGKSVYSSPHNYHRCRPELQETDATCPPIGFTGTLLGKDFCLSDYCSRETGTCQEQDHPMYQLGADGKGEGKEGKSAVKFGIVRLDDTSVNIEDSGAGTGKAGKTNDYQFDAKLSQNYVPCILGKPMPRTGLFSTKIAVDRTAGGSDCAQSESTIEVLGFKLDALIPNVEEAGLSNCKLIDVTAKENVIQGQAKKQRVGFEMCIKDESQQCKFTPENLLSLPLSQFFPKPEVCVPTDELELPEVKKDFKEAIVPLIVAIGLELDMCISGAFGLDPDSKMPQLEIEPRVGVGVVARGGVGSGESGVYEVSAGVRLLLTLVSIGFPVTWGVQADAALTDVNDNKIVGYLKIALVQRIAMALEFLSGEFGLYAKVEVGPFGYEWTFNIFEWTGIKVEVTLAQHNLLSKIIDFEVPRHSPPSKASLVCNDGENPCYQ